MGTIYETKDGQKFEYESDAQKHANKLAAEDAESEKRVNNFKSYIVGQKVDYNRIVRDFNAGNWHKLNKDAYSFISIDPYEGKAILMVAIARLNKSENYDEIYNDVKQFFDERYQFRSPCIEYKSDNEIGAMFKRFFELYEKASGRSLTDVEKNKFLPPTWDDINAMLPPREGISSSSSDYIDQRNGFVSFIFGLVCGVGTFFTSMWIAQMILGKITSLLVLLGMVAVGIISIVITAKAWKNRKNIIFIIMLILGIYGWLYIFGLNPDGTKFIEEQNTTEQTTGNNNIK